LLLLHDYRKLTPVQQRALLTLLAGLHSCSDDRRQL
jgi:hypothetical protein